MRRNMRRARVAVANIPLPGALIFDIRQSEHATTVDGV
jgi:hypothetical protein